MYDAVDLLLSLAVQTDGEGATASDPSSATLCKLLEYCVRVLKEAAGAGGKPEQSATSGVRSSTPPVHHRSLAQSASGAPLPLNEATGDKTTLHVLFVLRLLKSFLTNAAHSDRVRVLIVRWGNLRYVPFPQLASISLPSTYIDPRSSYGWWAMSWGSRSCS